MSRPVSLLFRRVSPYLASAARDLVPAAAAMGADVSSAEDVLRLAVEIGLVTLGCAAPPSPERGAIHLVEATLRARGDAANVPGLRDA